MGLRQLARLFDDVLDGNATEETLDVIRLTAEGIYYSRSISAYCVCRIAACQYTARQFHVTFYTIYVNLKRKVIFFTQ